MRFYPENYRLFQMFFLLIQKRGSTRALNLHSEILICDCPVRAQLALSAVRHRSVRVRLPRIAQIFFYVSHGR